jgi:hypothetical protein
MSDYSTVSASNESRPHGAPLVIRVRAAVADYFGHSGPSRQKRTTGDETKRDSFQAVESDALERESREYHHKDTKTQRND